MTPAGPRPGGEPPVPVEVAGLVARVATPVARRLGARVEYVALWLTAVVGLLLAGLATTGVAAVYDAVVERDGVAAFDAPVLREAIAWRTPGRDDAVRAFTDLGGSIGMPIIAALLVALMTWRWHTRKPLVLMVTATAGSIALTMVGKVAIGRARPDHSLAVPPYESSPSFPSGHTLNATVVAGIAAYLVLRRVRSRWARALTVVGAALFAGAIGLSRVFLGHHWLTDVMAGWALGAAWVAVVVTADALYRTLRDGRATPPR